LRITPINHDRGTAKFDLSFGLRELPQGFRAGIEYSADLFEEPTIERMVRHYEILLQQIIANPDQRIGCIPILTEAERRLYALHSPLPEPEPLPDITERFAVQAAATPDRIAVADGKQRLTYCQLDQRSNQLAHLLKGLGVGPEVCVGIYVERSVEMVVATMAVLKAGGAFVPLDLNNPPERFRTIVEIAKPTVLVTQEILAANIDCEGLKVVRLDTDYALIAQEPVQGLPLSASGENLAYVLFTSGSTGVPKGVMIERRMLSNTYRDYEEVYRLRSLSSHVQMANIAFDVYVGDFIRALCSGGKLVISPYDWVLDPPRLYALMRSEQADAAEFVPVVLRELIKYVEETGQSLDFMKLLVNSSDTWYVEEWRRFQKFIGPDTHLLNSYGATECTIDSTYYDNREIDRPSEQPVPAGKALPHSRMYILNDNMQLQPIGVAGEIYLGGESPARGYLNRPDLTAERFVPDPFSTSANAWMYRTGDSGRMAADGNVDFIGRLDYQVKIRGLRIELGEIEAVLMQHPAVAAGVVAKRTEHGGERLVGYVVWRPDQKTTFEALRSYLKSKLPTHFVPNVFVEMPELPLLPNGKIDRKTLPAPDLQAICPDGLYEAPQSTMEATMAEIWGQELGIERVGALDNFFDLGGHSLMLMKVIAQAENKLGVRLPPANFYTQTLRQIAARYEELLRQNSAAESSSRADESATVLQKAFRSFRSILGRK
jgi:amino acid adenylation domain-containing protein